MIKRNLVRFGFAVASDGAIVTPADAGKDRGPFVCPGCGGQMIPKRGRVRVPHFAHLVVECSPETYLHRTGKRLIAAKFNEAVAAGRPFVVERLRIVRCTKGRDVFPGVECERGEPVRLDLTKWYRLAEVERGASGFVADVLLSGPQGVLALEVVVTHKCSEEKIASGLRILEFAIASEADLAGLFEEIPTIGRVSAEYNCQPLEARQNDLCSVKTCPSETAYAVVWRSGKGYIDLDENLAKAKSVARSGADFVALCSGLADGVAQMVAASEAGKCTWQSCSACHFQVVQDRWKYCEVKRRNCMEGEGMNCYLYRPRRGIFEGKKP